MREDFAEVARVHWARYPLMEPQDFAKLAYQSEFGPAHMAQSPDKVLAALLAEWKEAGPEPKGPEPIGNGLCRFHITQALSPLSDLPLVGRIFTGTMGFIKGTEAGLCEKLEWLAGLPVPGMGAYLEGWRREGCPPVRHSEAFRSAYGPHYRVVRLDFAGFLPALTVLDRFSRERGAGPHLIAVDGRCGSGKTSFAAAAGELIPGAGHVVHMDDFYLPWERRAEDWMDVPAGNMDLERFQRDVLLPLCSGKPAAYRSALPGGQAPGEYGALVEIDPGDAKMILVEGTYSQHPSLAEYYDYRLFFTCGKEEQTHRLRLREGDYYPTFNRLWRALEETYFASCGVEAAADLTVDTTGFFS